MSGGIDRRERGPWLPERGQYVNVWGIAVPEWAAFTIVMAVCAGMIAVLAVIALL